MTSVDHRTLRRGFAVGAALCALGAAGCAGSSDPAATADPSSTTATAPPTGAPPELAEHRTDWVLPGHDYDNSRAATGSSLTAANISKLSTAWSAEVGGSLSTVPIVVGDTVYVQDGSGRISAIDRADGRLRWKTAGTGTNIGPFGVAVGDGLVYGLHGSDGVVAVDARTGTPRWTSTVTTTKTEGVDIQPLYFDGRVYVSTVPVSIGGIYAGGDRGRITALDSATGRILWRFDTVKSADLWGHPEINSGGGAWFPPAVEPPSGRMFWGIANPAPFPGTAEFPNGSSRPGPNLYTDSTVALDAATGALQWYRQANAHDLFDRDLIHTMIVRTGNRRVVVATGKGGVVYGLDPVTGARLWSRAVGVHRNDRLRSLSGATEIAPGTYGGVLTPPATADGVVYVAALNEPVTLRPDETAYFGAELGRHEGSLVAIDARSGRVRWSATVPGDPLGGVTVINDLVITVTVDGELVAYDRDSGELLTRHPLPGGVNGWPAAAADLLIVPVGNADPPRLIALRAG